MMKTKSTARTLALLALFSWSLLLVPAWSLFSQSNSSTEEIRRNPRDWVQQQFAKGKIPPFSFTYGGKSSDRFIKTWRFNAGWWRRAEANTEERLYTWTDPAGGLTVKCFVTVFSDFPAVEWLLRFSNSSAKNTPLIEKAAVIHHSFASTTKGSFTLHHAKGSNAEIIDYQPYSTILDAGKNVYLTPAGGRSSDNTALPFFNIEMPDQQGVMAAVGWTGKWYAEAAQTGVDQVTLTSGMERMRLSLYPSEEIRTPKICLLFWQGENRMIGHNRFRQFILQHHSRKINGRFADYPISVGFTCGDPSPCHEYICLTEDQAIAIVKRYRQFQISPEVFWLDAGWYSGCGWDKKSGGWSDNVGNWTVDTERFPNGLRPVADAVHDAGAKFLVWFEPERVRPGTKIDREHPQWPLRVPGVMNALFNLGDDEARIWLTDYISEFLKREGIDYYRQDFNFDPMPYWEANDRPGRTGMSEIKHIQGLYAFWDSLLVRFPNLLIDNCASGGRRIDLETTSRSAPLWRTDYSYGEPTGYQCHSYGLHYYLPIHGTGIFKPDDYTFRSGLGAAAVLGWNINDKSVTIREMQNLISTFKELRPFIYGDYYPLTGVRNYHQQHIWLAYQFNRPDQSDGLVAAFRRKDCYMEKITVQLNGLLEAGTYELCYANENVRTLKTGKEMMEGFELYSASRPASLLIRYQLKN